MSPNLNRACRYLFLFSFIMVIIFSVGFNFFLYGEQNIVATYGNTNISSDTLQVKVPFQIRDTIDIHAGYYFDNNANGFVDSIYVEATTDIGGGLTNAHVHEIISSAITLPYFRNFNVIGSGVVSGGFYIYVKEDNAYPTTYVTSDDKLTFKPHILTMGGLVKDTTVPIYDRIAPIIHWVFNSVYLIDMDADSIADTLEVKFSEPVENVVSDEPFYFLDIDENKHYSVTLESVSQPEPDIMVFIINAFTGVERMEYGDSVWIHEIDRVGDTANNYQNNPMNTRRKIVTLPSQIKHNNFFTLNNSNFYITRLASQKYILRVSNLSHSALVNLYTVNGRRILQKQLLEGNSCLFLPEALSKTVYILYLESGDHTLRKKLTIK